MRAGKIVVGACAGLVALCLGLLLVGYSPLLFNYRFTQIEPLEIRGECPAGSKLDLRFQLVEPALLAFETPVDLIIDLTKDCRKLILSPSGPVSIINQADIFVPGDADEAALDAKGAFDREAAVQAKPAPFDYVGATGKTLTIDETGNDGALSVRIQRAGLAMRTSFASFEVFSMLRLADGTWRIDMPSTPAVLRKGGEAHILPMESWGPEANQGYAYNYLRREALAGGEMIERTVKAPTVERVTATYSVEIASLANLNEVFAIIISTLLGVAISTLVETAAWLIRR